MEKVHRLPLASRAAVLTGRAALSDRDPSQRQRLTDHAAPTTANAPATAMPPPPNLLAQRAQGSRQYLRGLYDDLDTAELDGQDSGAAPPAVTREWSERLKVRQV